MLPCLYPQNLLDLQVGTSYQEMPIDRRLEIGLGTRRRCVCAVRSDSHESPQGLHVQGSRCGRQDHPVDERW